MILRPREGAKWPEEMRGNRQLERVEGQAIPYLGRTEARYWEGSRLEWTLTYNSEIIIPLYVLFFFIHYITTLSLDIIIVLITIFPWSLVLKWTNIF